MSGARSRLLSIVLWWLAVACVLGPPAYVVADKIGLIGPSGLVITAVGVLPTPGTNATIPTSAAVRAAITAGGGNVTAAEAGTDNYLACFASASALKKCGIAQDSSGNLLLGTIVAADNATIIRTGTTTGNSFYLGANNTRLMSFVEGATSAASYGYLGNSTTGGRWDNAGTFRFPTSLTGVVKSTSGVVAAATIGTDYCGPVTKVDAGDNRTLTATQLQCLGLNLTNHGQNATRVIHTLPNGDTEAYYSGMISIVDVNATRIVGIKPATMQYIDYVAGNGTIHAGAQNATWGIVAKTSGCRVAFDLPFQTRWQLKVIAGDGNCTPAAR